MTIKGEVHVSFTTADYTGVARWFERKYKRKPHPREVRECLRYIAQLAFTEFVHKQEDSECSSDSATAKFPSPSTATK